MSRPALPAGADRGAGTNISAATSAPETGLSVRTGVGMGPPWPRSIPNPGRAGETILGALHTAESVEPDFSCAARAFARAPFDGEGAYATAGGGRVRARLRVMPPDISRWRCWRILFTSMPTICRRTWRWRGHVLYELGRDTIGERDLPGNLRESAVPPALAKLGINSRTAKHVPPLAPTVVLPKKIICRSIRRIRISRKSRCANRSHPPTMRGCLGNVDMERDERSMPGCGRMDTCKDYVSL